MSATDILAKTSTLPWVPIADGIDFRLLRTSSETGLWTVLFRCQKGSSFDRHRHYGAGEYFVITGKMKYRAGVAETGDWGLEPLGAVHDHTEFLEYTELLFTNHGPVAYLDDDDSITAILDYQLLEELASAHGDGD